MKIQFRQIEGFVKSPDKTARVILVYGPDYGLMRERASTLGKTVVSDLNDPFNVATLSTDILQDDPARLSDEAGAISMMGGDRLIRVESATDKITTSIKDYLSNPSDHALIILEAGELGPRSSLRKLCESAKNAAALPCYIEDERDISRLIRDMISQENLQIDHDAIQYLASNITGDRLKARGEIEKLIIYKGQEQSSITLEETQAICGSSGAQSLDNLVYSSAGNNPSKSFQAFHTLIQEGTPLITILRSLQNHFRRLHATRARYDQGDDMKSAMKGLMPPVFFKQEQAFSGQVQRWSLAALNTVLSKLSDLEAQTKQSGVPAETLCAQTILALSAKR